MFEDTGLHGLKIGAIVPVGEIDNMGYQYNVETVLNNLIDNFDFIVVVSSSRKTVRLPVEHHKIKLYSSSEFWSKLDLNGNESFDFNNTNTSRMLSELTALGFDFAVNISINQYIDPDKMIGLNKYCYWLKRENKKFGWLYKSCQVGEFVTYPYARLPWVINLKFSEEISFCPDAIRFGSEHVYIQNGFYPEAPFHVVDIYGELTKADYDVKVSKYLTFLDNFNPLIDWKTVVKYHEKKLEQRVLRRSSRLSETGMKVLNNYHSESLTNLMDIKFRPYWRASVSKWKARVVSFLREK